MHLWILSMNMCRCMYYTKGPPQAVMILLSQKDSDHVHASGVVGNRPSIAPKPRIKPKPGESLHVYIFFC